MRNREVPQKPFPAYSSRFANLIVASKKDVPDKTPYFNSIHKKATAQIYGMFRGFTGFAIPFSQKSI